MIIIGKDGKEYSSIKECLAADEEFDRKVEAEAKAKEAARIENEKKVAEQKALTSKRKKELSTAIEEASEKVKQVVREYDDAKKEAASIILEAKKKANEIVAAAAKKVEEASYVKTKAIADFNKEFGPYQTVLTGNQAFDEYSRMLKSFIEAWF